MEQQNNHSKEAIRQRMFNHAASFWGVRSIEDLDPIVIRLIESLASEIYNINHIIQDMNVRILESLAGMLTPSVLISPRPAHTVIQVNPLETVLFLDDHTVFHDKKIPHELKKQGLDSFSFVPVTNTRLISGKIKYMVCERMFFRMENDGRKTLLANASTFSEKLNYTAWIGLSLHSEIETLKDIAFFIDFPHTDNKYEKYSLLPYSKWSYGGQDLQMSVGMPIWKDEEEMDDAFENLIFNKYSLLNQMDTNILDLYRMQFLTIGNDMRLSAMKREAFPAEIINLFPENATTMPEPCFWLKVTFPPHISALNIQDLTVNINAFPIANKIPYSKIYAPNDMTGIVPLRTERGEFFLSVDRVSDASGREYHSIPYTTDRNREPGVYTVKQGGAERFDIRDAKEYVERLIDLLRSETSAFTSMDMDNMRNIIASLQKGLVDIEAKLNNSKMEALETPRYLLLNTRSKDDSVFVDYWGTNCETANGLRAGKTLTPLTSIPVDKDSCRLLKPTSGGKPAPNVTGKLDAFRYVMASRDSITTHDDIANFCRCELGNKVTHIEVARGVDISPKPKEGLIRVIRVILTPTPGFEGIVNEMQTDLLTLLHRKSPDSFNYRIAISN